MDYQQGTWRQLRIPCTTLPGRFATGRQQLKPCKPEAATKFRKQLVVLQIHSSVIRAI